MAHAVQVHEPVYRMEKVINVFLWALFIFLLAILIGSAIDDVIHMHEFPLSQTIGLAICIVGGLVLLLSARRS